MGISKLFWKAYHLARNPDKLYQEGFEDAINDRARRQFKASIIFSEIKNLQENYDKGYNDGIREKLIRRI